MVKNKQELIEEAAKIAVLHKQKKEVIEKLLNDLDKEEKMSSKHINGIATVNELLKEMSILEGQHEEILNKIKE